MQAYLNYGGLYVPHKIFSLFYKRKELQKYFAIIALATCLFCMITHAICLFFMIVHTICLFFLIAHAICLFFHNRIYHLFFAVIAHLIYLFVCAIMEKKTDSMCYCEQKIDIMCYHRKKTDSKCHQDKKTDSMWCHGKKTDNMCYHRKKTVCAIMAKYFCSSFLL